ncbi:hypothetical protein ACUVMQ_21490 [Aeromonas veronii]|uniref:hypothetical protein n=1 Tax=Aeromonas veronii TaxID=654 RepID=UPI0040558621
MLAYASYPFANGLGCDFTADVEDSLRAVHVECFAGHMTQVYRAKTIGRTFVTHSIYGKKGNTIFMIPFDVDYRDTTSDTTNVGVYTSQLTDYVEASKIMSFKLFESDVDDDDIILWDSPIMRIYKIKRIGKLSFL